jgi:hypothetical protein
MCKGKTDIKAGLGVGVRGMSFTADIHGYSFYRKSIKWLGRRLWEICGSDLRWSHSPYSNLYKFVSVFERGHLIVGTPIKKTTSLRFMHSSPLLEKEGNAVESALSANGDHPLALHRSCADSTFATNNHPVDSVQIHRAQILQKRLDREKPNSSRGGA